MPVSSQTAQGSLNLLPAKTEPRACNLNAVVTLTQSAGAQPLYLTVTVAGHQDQYPFEAGKLVALQVPVAHPPSFSITLIWSDGSRSDFGTFGDCAAATNKSANDDRAKISLSIP